MEFTVCEPKARAAGFSVTAGAGAAVPVPLSVIACGLPGPLSVMLTDAVLDPVPVGLNVTEIVQLAPAATAAPQVFACAKSPEFVPVIVILVTDKAALLRFVRTLACAVLAVLKV